MMEGIPISLITAALGVGGLTGLVPIFWYVDHRRMQRQRDEDQKDRQKQRDEDLKDRQKQREEDLKDRQRRREQDKRDLQRVLGQYKEDMRNVTHFYETNVELVKSYEKLASELTHIIQLNTQAQTQLVEKIKNNMFCPIIRKRTPEGQ